LIDRTLEGFVELLKVSWSVVFVLLDEIVELSFFDSVFERCHFEPPKRPTIISIA
jgi:hypothetical protein